MTLLLAITVGSLFAGAVYLLLRRSLVKLIMGMILMSHGVNLLIFIQGDGVRRAAVPIVDAQGVPPPAAADPLVQALILTAIVISFGAIAFVMALGYRANQAANSDDLDAMISTDRL